MKQVTSGFPRTRIQHGRLAAVLLMAAVLAGCAVPAPRPGIPPDTGSVPPPADPQPLPAEEPPPVQAAPQEPAPIAPAATALVAQSEQAIVAGDLRLAGLQLERALRIAPRDPGLWHRLAQVRLQQGEFQQAERMAERSLQLGSADRSLMLANWRVIAMAREGMGDAEGAQRALDEMRRLERALG
jgi:predicted Zn-dependent protease